MRTKRLIIDDPLVVLSFHNDQLIVRSLAAGAEASQFSVARNEVIPVIMGKDITEGDYVRLANKWRTPEYY